MQQQIRGWRFAAERTHRRRGTRDDQLAVSAKLMAGVAMAACRALGRMARQAQEDRTKRRRPGMRSLRTSRSAPRKRAMRPMRSKRSVPSMPSMPDLRTIQAIQDMRAIQAMQAMGERARPAMRSVPGHITMKHVAGGMGVLAAGVGVGMARRMAGRSRTVQTSKDRAPKNRWIMVTINCSPQRLASRADLPEPITRLGDAVDIKICAAPGDRGTELGARLRDLPRTRVAGMIMRRPEADPRIMVERALRDAKAIIETGEVTRRDWPPSAQPAQGGKLLEFAGRRGGRS